MNWVMDKHWIFFHFLLLVVDVVPDIPCVVVTVLPCVVVVIIAVALAFSSDVGSVLVTLLAPS